MMMYTIEMVKRYGVEEVEKMKDTKWDLKKVKSDWLYEIIEEYKELVMSDSRYNTNPKPVPPIRLTIREKKEQEIQDRIDKAVREAIG